MSVPILVFSIITISVLVATELFGGLPWLLIAGAGLGSLAMAGRKWGDAALLGLALVWLFAFHFSGYRQLFFPFSMYVAVYVAVMLTERSLWAATGCGTGVVVAFLAIRALQYATPRVLKVELLAAAAILAVFEGIYLLGPPSLPSRFVVLILASLAAVAALAL